MYFKKKDVKTLQHKEKVLKSLQWSSRHRPH